MQHIDTFFTPARGIDGSDMRPSDMLVDDRSCVRPIAYLNPSLLPVSVVSLALRITLSTGMKESSLS